MLTDYGVQGKGSLRMTPGFWEISYSSSWKSQRAKAAIVGRVLFADRMVRDRITTRGKILSKYVTTNAK